MRSRRITGWPIGRGDATIASRAELFKDAARLLEVLFGDRTRAGLRDEAAEGQMAERRLIALAQQIEECRALREVVVRVGGAAALRVETAAEPQVLAPCGR